MILPNTIKAGVTLEFTANLPAYLPDDGWGLTVVLRGPQSIDLTSTPDGVLHGVRVDAATTSGWAPGRYWYSVRVSDGTDVYEIEDGTLDVEPDLASVSGDYDGRHHVDRVLEAIEAVIEGRATKDQQSYKINNRELQRTPVGDLLRLRSSYRDELRRVRAAEKGQSLLGRKVMVRF